jgi:hypothetical protein
MLRMYASNSHSYTHLILALGIVREPTVWDFITSNISWHTLHWPAYYCTTILAHVLYTRTSTTIHAHVLHTRTHAPEGGALERDDTALHGSRALSEEQR